MKQIKISQLAKEYARVLQHIPRKGLIITKDGKPIGKVVRPDFKEIQSDVEAQAENVIRKIRLDTFTEIDAPRPQRLGSCQRCGYHGELVKKGFVNERGTIVSMWMCTKNCVKWKPNIGNSKINKLNKSLPIEQTHNSGTKKEIKDFGAASEPTTF